MYISHSKITKKDIYLFNIVLTTSKKANKEMA